MRKPTFPDIHSPGSMHHSHDGFVRSGDAQSARWNFNRVWWVTR